MTQKDVYKRQLKVDTADEFDEIYPIDLSYLFFFRCVPLQKEVLDESICAVSYTHLVSTFHDCS